MGPWTNQAGYPVLHVSLSGINAVITQVMISMCRIYNLYTALFFFQRRFLLNSSESSNFKWDVPITYTISHGPDFTNTTPVRWLLAEEDGVVIENILHGGTGWVILNIQGTGKSSSLPSEKLNLQIWFY